MNILRLALLSLAAVIAVSLGTHLLFQTGGWDEPSKPATTSAALDRRNATDENIADVRRKIEAKLSEAPDYARFYDRLRLDLPGEYDALIDEFAKRAQAGVVMWNADFLMSEAVRALRVSRGVVAAKADGPALTRIFEMQLLVLRALAGKQPRLCVDFLYGGASEGFFNFSADHRSLVADMALAGLNAIKDGQAKRIDRAPPSETDFDLLEQALKKRGLTDPELEALLDGKAPDPPIPDARMCEIGQIYLETLATLPEPIKLRIYGLAVELMARS
jgi:hypothetical protein